MGNNTQKSKPFLRELPVTRVVNHIIPLLRWNNLEYHKKIREWNSIFKLSNCSFHKLIKASTVCYGRSYWMKAFWQSYLSKIHLKEWNTTINWPEFQYRHQFSKLFILTQLLNSINGHLILRSSRTVLTIYYSGLNIKWRKYKNCWIKK